MKTRSWIPNECEKTIQLLDNKYTSYSSEALENELNDLISENLMIHNEQCINLNPAGNVMNPKAEAVLSRGLGTRASLGYPGDKYEMGLEAIEKIEVMATKLACDIFETQFAEIRVASGAMANLYAFMATCKPGDTIIVPPTEIGGHVTHHQDGAAGLFGLSIHHAPFDHSKYTVDIQALSKLAVEVKPRLISIGGSLNLFPHPLADIREIADQHGAKVLFDAAHLSGMVAGKAWQQPLSEGAHLMTMSTYKSLGGPPSGLILTNDEQLAKKLDKIAFPGLTANFDVSKSAALAISLLDWKEFGNQYAKTMAETAKELAGELSDHDVPVFAGENGFTQSHQFAIEAAKFGGGQTAAKKLRQANLLTCGIGLPIEPVEGDLNGLRIGTPEIVRLGMTPQHMPQLAKFISEALKESRTPAIIGQEVSAFRQQFKDLQFIR